MNLNRAIAEARDLLRTFPADEECRVFSLRSTDEGMDVSAVAKGYGGGGHVRASGFRMPIGWEGDKAA